MCRTSKGLVLTLTAVALALPGTGLAGDIRVRPVTVEAPMGADATSVVVTHGGTAPVRAQFRVMRWTQVDGRDVLTPTTDVTISPPQVELDPNRPYTVRIVRTAESAVSGEEAYRLLVDEIPGSSPVETSGVDLVIQQRLPVFFSSRGSPEAVVDWSLQPADGRMWLTATNRGSRHLRLADVQLRQGNQIVGEVDGLVGYILPGSTMRWPLDIRGGAAGTPFRLEAQSSGGRIEASFADDGVR